MKRQGVFTYPEIDRVVFGTPFVEALKTEADRLGVSRIFVLASGTLVRETDCLSRLETEMGGRIAGVYDRLRPHVQREDVLEATTAARELGADLVFDGHLQLGCKQVILGSVMLFKQIAEPHTGRVERIC